MFRKLFKRETESAGSQKAPARLKKTSSETASGNLGGAVKPAAKKKQPSYDPYNSGVFDKGGAWNKVTRK
jgi:hypothetical protein